MGLLTLLLIAVGLAMDAFAISMSSGVAVRKWKPLYGVKIGLFCGLFQFIMPLLGWLLGTTVSGYIEAVDHWIAFALLALIGGKMIFEALKKDTDKEAAPLSEKELFSFKRLTLLAIATSIDALAVGVSFALLEINIWEAGVMIGLVTFFFAFLGNYLGHKLGALLKDKAELLGGILLVLMGLRILFDHLFAK